MNVLIVGSGGREHALAWKCAQGAEVGTVYLAPGNAGTASEAGCSNAGIAVDDFEALAAFAAEKEVGLTIVGPEAPLVDGICDFFAERGLACFGPSRRAARLEGSKEFTKAFLERHGIPSAAYRAFTDVSEATAYVRRKGAPIVIKADGLAAGKGVVVAHTEDEAVSAVETMLSGHAFGAAGTKVVIEDFLAGEEASFICLCDGVHAVPLATSQDHKARDEGGGGPNTGGMGAYSPAPVVTAEVHQRIMAQVIEPTMRGMAEEGAPYVGFLYAGLMITDDGTPRVIEFNCRFGDPEAQPVLARLRSDLAMLCRKALDDGLADVELQWDERVALGVVMAAGGYPERYDKGDVIIGLEALAGERDVLVFHAGTTARGDQLVTNGGRILCVVGLGDDLASARDKAYAGVDRVTWRNCYFRRDIGRRGLGISAARAN